MRFLSSYSFSSSSCFSLKSNFWFYFSWKLYSLPNNFRRLFPFLCFSLYLSNFTHLISHYWMLLTCFLYLFVFHSLISEIWLFTYLKFRFIFSIYSIISFSFDVSSILVLQLNSTEKVKGNTISANVWKLKEVRQNANFQEGNQRDRRQISFGEKYLNSIGLFSFWVSKRKSFHFVPKEGKNRPPQDLIYWNVIFPLSVSGWPHILRHVWWN